MTLQIGIARADITPPVGIAMVGFAGRDVARDVHDPLYATALVVDDGDTRLVLISLDLLQLMAGTVDAYRARIATITGIPPGRIILACTHNHYGPSVDRDEADVVDSYREHLSHVLAGVAARATDHLRPARIGISWGLSDIGIAGSGAMASSSWATIGTVPSTDRSASPASTQRTDSPWRRW